MAKIVTNEQLIKEIEKVGDIKQFDKAIKKTAKQSYRRLGTNTPRDTGHTARNWTVTKKIKEGVYQTSNKVKTSDKKHLLVNILNDGRRETRPKRTRKLYIPLTNKGKAKARNAKFGVDYILADKAKAYKGTKFLDKEIEQASKDLRKNISKRLDELTK